MAEMVRAHIFVQGRVQGVFFRQKTKDKADSFGVTGWIQNLADGRVEAVFEGERDKVEQMVDWARQGPFFAKVDSMELTWDDYQRELNSFEIRHSR